MRLLRRQLMRICPLLGIALGTQAASGQIEIAKAGFEVPGDSWEWTLVSINIPGTSGLSTDPGSGDVPADQRIWDGFASWQTVAGAQGTVDFDELDVSAFAGYSFRLSLELTSTAGSSGHGAEALDRFSAYVALNGGGFPVLPDITVTGNDEARWGTTATGVAFTIAGTPAFFAPAGGGDRTTDGYYSIQIDIPSGTTSIDLRLYAVNDQQQERWNVDNVRLHAIPEPTDPLLISGASVLGFAAWRYSRRARPSAR